jgi:hypothetical protein
MPKKICCCNEKPNAKKYYIAIPCYEYNSNIYAEVGTQFLFKGFDYGISLSNPGPTTPFIVVGTRDQYNSWKIGPDVNREISVMMRAGGGGSRPLSYGGNAAYADFIAIPGNYFRLTSMAAFVPPGGTGPEPGNYDIHTGIPMFGGGPGYPIAAWGGGAAGWGYYNEIQLGGRVIVGAGAGSGGKTKTTGGHGGIDSGLTGTGEFPGEGGLQDLGGNGGDINAEPGSFTKGGKGTGSWSSTITPSENSGGGGGAGYYGGGGGGDGSAGGGGSTTKEDILSHSTIDSAGLFEGTDLGPGNRCTPYFTFEYDPGLGGQRDGREINGNLFHTGYSGAPGQVAEYHRTKWCPCTEEQTNPLDGSTGKITGPLHKCLTEEQYQEILSQLPDIDPPPDLSGIRISFELDGEKYILVQIDPDTTDPTTGHYYCTLGCEDIFLDYNTPANVRWYIPSKNFTCFSEVFDWFANHLEYDFSNITSCCDCFLGKPICTNPYESCLGSYDAQGNPTGCLCGATAPAPAAVCKDYLPDQDAAYYSFDEATKWVYLVVPGICWTYFGNENLVKKFECKSTSQKIVYRGTTPSEPILLPNLGEVTTIDATEITEKFCNQTINRAYCSDTGGVDCQVTLFKVHPYCDYYGIKCPLVISSTAKLCVRDVYGCISCPPHPSTKMVGVAVDTTLTFKCDKNPCEGDCTSWYSDGTPCVDDCPNYTPSTLVGNIFSSNNKIFSTFGSKNISGYRTVVYLADKAKKLLNYFGIYGYDSETNQVNPISTGVFSRLINYDPDIFSPRMGGIDGGGGGQGGDNGGGNDICPCEVGGSIPTQACLNAIRTGYKFQITRLKCPPDDFLECICSDTCPGPDRDACYCTQQLSWINAIDEKNSWESLTCFSYDNKVDVSGLPPVENVMQIKFPACMFSGLDEAASLSKALSMVSVTQEPTFPVQVGYEGVVYTKDVHVMTVCGLQILLVSCGTEYICEKINQCLGGLNGGIVATPKNPYVWFTYRFEVCTPTSTTPQDPIVYWNKGDKLFVAGATYNPTDQSVTVTLNAYNGEAATACVAVKTEPFCINGESCGQGVNNEAKSLAAITAADWSSGTRWTFKQYEQIAGPEDVDVRSSCDPNPLLAQTVPYVSGLPSEIVDGQKVGCMGGTQKIQVDTYGPDGINCNPPPCIPGQFNNCCQDVNTGINKPCPKTFEQSCTQCGPGGICTYVPECKTTKQCTTDATNIIITTG